MWKSGHLCKLVLGLSTHECSTGQQPLSLGAGLYGLSYDCFFPFFFSLSLCSNMRQRCLFFPLATVGSDVSIRDGLNSWPVCVGFFGYYNDDDGGSSGEDQPCWVWVMGFVGMWKCGERGRERDICFSK